MLSTYILLGNFVIVSLRGKTWSSGFICKDTTIRLHFGPFLSPYFILEDGIDT